MSAAKPIDHGDLEARVAWLNQVRLFEGVRELPGAIAHIANVMEFRRYGKGVAILNDGEQGEDAFVLIAGTTKVLKTSASGEAFPVAMLDAKDHPFFGEAALVQSDKRSATILTETPCDCLILHKRAFEALCREHPLWALPLALKIARVILERLYRANDDVVLLYNALLNEVKGWNG